VVQEVLHFMAVFVVEKVQLCFEALVVAKDLQAGSAIVIKTAHAQTPVAIQNLKSLGIPSN
jgi:hypothetical protein